MAIQVETMQTVVKAVTSDYNAKMQEAARITEAFASRVQKALNAINGMSSKVAPDIDTTGLENDVSTISSQRERLEGEYERIARDAMQLKERVDGLNFGESQRFMDTTRLAEYEKQLSDIQIEIAKLDKAEKSGATQNNKAGAFERVSTEIGKATTAMEAFEAKAVSANATLSQMATNATVLADKMSKAAAVKLPQGTNPINKPPTSDAAKHTKEWENTHRAVNKTNDAVKKVGSSTQGASRYAGGLLSMFGRFMKMMVVFRAIFYIMSKMGEVFGSAAKQSASLQSTLDNIKTIMTAIVTMLAVIIMPIIRAISPALEGVAQSFLNVGNTIAQFIANMLGQDSYLAATYIQDKWGDNGVKNVNKVKGALLGFDKLNVLNDKNEVGGAGASAGSADIKFEERPIGKAEQELTLWEKIKKFVLDMNDKIFGEWWNKFWAGVGAGAVDAWYAVRDFFVNTWKAISDFFVKAFEGSMEGYRKAWESIKQTWKTVVDFITKCWDGIKEGWDSTWSGISNWWSSIVSGLVKRWSDEWGVFSPFGSMETGFKNALNTMITQWNKFASTLNKGFKTLNEVLGTNWNIPLANYIGSEDTSGYTSNQYSTKRGGAQSMYVPQYASGTVVQPNNPHLAMFGDNTQAPEIVSPVPTIISAVKQANESGGGSTNTEMIRLMRQLIVAVTADRKTTLNVDGKPFAQATARHTMAEFKRLDLSYAGQKA